MGKSDAHYLTGDCLPMLRFKLFKQKCTLILEGPLESASPLGSETKGLEIYNAAIWTAEADKLKLAPI